MDTLSCTKVLYAYLYIQETLRDVLTSGIYKHLQRVLQACSRGISMGLMQLPRGFSPEDVGYDRDVRGLRYVLIQMRVTVVCLFCVFVCICGLCIYQVMTLLYVYCNPPVRLCKSC